MASGGSVVGSAGGPPSASTSALTRAVKVTLTQALGRQDLADEVTRVEANWGTCPVHGRFSDGLIVYRGDDEGEPTPVRLTLDDPDSVALGRAVYAVYAPLRAALGEPPLHEVTPEMAKHVHCRP
jgi:hypothetical protein